MKLIYNLQVIFINNLRNLQLFAFFEDINYNFFLDVKNEVTIRNHHFDP